MLKIAAYFWLIGGLVVSFSVFLYGPFFASQKSGRVFFGSPSGILPPPKGGFCQQMMVVVFLKEGVILSLNMRDLGPY